MKTIKLKNSLAREIKIYGKYDSAIPKGAFSVKSGAPDLSGVLYPLPSRKKDYTCFAKYGNVLWLGAPNGLTRYDAEAENEVDKVQFFSASRDLPDNDVKAIYVEEGEKESVWVKTASGVTNMVLDALFVGLFSWGVVGAAIATMSSQVVGSMIPLIFFLNKNNNTVCDL